MAAESGQVTLAAYPFEIEYYRGGEGRMLQIYPTFLQDSLVFENVAKSEVFIDYTESDNPSFYYYGKDAGLIRYETQNEFGIWRIWKLKRYHAVR
jgi:hypothetical protein